jgi:peroxiredoxin
MRKDNLYELPSDIPVPIDDGACDHLLGAKVPSIKLRSTASRWVNLAEATEQKVVVYCYPRTGLPDKDFTGGMEVWNSIPGARGCTPQSCAFRDEFSRLQSLNVLLFGLSTQSTEYQQEMAARLHLPFEVLSDSELAFTKALSLPTFEFESMTLIKRLTFIVERGRISKVFYPVFPPDKNAGEVIAWLSSRRD